MTIGFFNRPTGKRWVSTRCPSARPGSSKINPPDRAPSRRCRLATAARFCSVFQRDTSIGFAVCRKHELPLASPRRLTEEIGSPWTTLRASLISARLHGDAAEMNYNVAIRQRIIGTTPRLRYSPDLSPVEHLLKTNTGCAALRSEQLAIVDQWIEGTFNHFGYSQVQVPLLLFGARIASPLHFTVI